MNGQDDFEINQLLESDLRAIRQRLFTKVVNSNRSQAVLDVQRLLADEIMRCESIRKHDKRLIFKKHLNRLRYYGDCISWKFLHAHTIRQLSKQNTPVPSIINQKESFEHVFRIAEKAVSMLKVPVIISDITNCLKIGDIIIAAHPEKPIIVECKRSKNTRYDAIGRRGRQLQRMNKVVEYLRNGKVYDGEKEILTIEGTVPPKYNWITINELLHEAEKSGQSTRIVSKYEVLYVVSNWKRFDPSYGLEHAELDLNNPIVTIHTEAINNTISLVPPLSIWEVDDKFKFRLTEGELLVVHIFNPRGLIGIGNNYGSITGVDIEIPNTKELGYEVTKNDEKILLSSTFMTHISYGYQTIESVADAMIETGALPRSR